MKRKSKMFLTLAMCACITFGAVGFSACENNSGGDDTHEHTYATTWSSDADNHWHAPTCNDTTEVKDKAAHVDENADGKCDVCEHSVPLPHQHTYAEEWTTDANYHWHAPTCNDTEELADKAAHIDENDDEKCDVCDYRLPHNHKYAEEWSSNEDNHWHAPTCGDTMIVKDFESHVDEDDNEKCDVCDRQLPHRHRYSDQWSSDATSHWHAPTCGDTEEPADRASHIDEDKDYKCDVCDYDLPQPGESIEITISANSTKDIEIYLEAGVYELKMKLDEGITAIQGGLTAHVNGSTTENKYDMYEGHSGTYYAVLFVRDDSTAITLTNTTGEDISANYSLETYVAPTIKADGTEYVLPMLVIRTGHDYRSLFIPVESLSGDYIITVSNVATTYNGTSFTVFKNGSTSVSTGRLASFSSSSSWGPRTVDMTGVNSLLFRAGATATSIDYNITVKIEPAV